LTQSLAPIDSGTDKQRSTRVVQAMPIKVTGVDALREPFTEQTSTVMVSCHGCKYQSKYYVPKGSIVTVEIPRLARASSPRTVTARVIWVQRPRNASEVLHIGLEFEVPGNAWDIPIPPEDWFPLPGEPEFVAEEPAAATAISAVTPDELIGTITSWDESEILVASKSEPEYESQFAVAHPTAKPGASTALTNGQTSNQPMLDPKIQEAIEQAVSSSIARLSQSIVEEARKACEANTEELYAKIKMTVEEAVSNLPKRLKTKKKK
jgi:PilZ domain